MEQKQIKLIGLKVQNNGIIKAAELTPDILSKRLVLITGETGNGKSTLLNSAKIATAGTDAIKKSDAIPDGFISEALLLDGDIPIYIGVKTDTYKRGENAGKTKNETYLYTKDINGKAVQPIIDGVAWTAAQYWKALTTELTHSFSDLFSENQSVHRKLIEKLFKPELEAMKIDEVMEKIEKAKKERDTARTLCQANGAFMERFEDEGYNENKLAMLKPINVKEIESKITTLVLEKDRKINGGDMAWQLEKNKIDTARNNALQAIKDEGSQITESIRLDKEKKDKEYLRLLEDYKLLLKYYNEDKESFSQAEFALKNLYREGSEDLKAILTIMEKKKQLIIATAPIEPTTPQYDDTLGKQREAKLAEYKALSEKPLEYPEKGDIDISDIDAKIVSLNSEKEAASNINSIYNRYQFWLEWIEAKGKYEKEIDTLRKLYASIDTGVEGMKIVPAETESGRVEVWVMYNGKYNPQYFSNEKQEFRFMFDYSSFQRTIIGLMLQSARLNLKPKALRIAFVDDVAFTSRDIEVLTNIAEQLDLKLITAWTHEVDKESLLDGQVLVDGGEIFF